MRKRIFVGINIPEKDKKVLARTISKWQDLLSTILESNGQKKMVLGLPVRWTKPDSLHITVLFIGSAMDYEVADICDDVRQAAREIIPFDLEFSRVELLRNHAVQPKQKTLDNVAAPKLIWTIGEKSKELAALKKAVEGQLRGVEGKPPRQAAACHPSTEGNHLYLSTEENHPCPSTEGNIMPHITLGRIYGSKWKKLENPPEIDEKISFSVSVDSIEIMESNMLKDGVEYIVLDSIKL